MGMVLTPDGDLYTIQFDGSAWRPLGALRIAA